MRRRTLALASLTLALVLGGCSSNTITDSRGQATGLKYYTARPVLLPVGKEKPDATAATFSNFPIALVTIPDTRRPQFVELGTGFGKSGMELSMTEGGSESGAFVGFATKFQQLETKQDVPKAITAITNGAATIIGAVAVKNAVEK